jgi:uncharacterized protein involved in exopolysaccharide biosynthesis/Mrp family chromosome partitioning ATPase
MSEPLTPALVKKQDFTLSKMQTPRPIPVAHQSSLNRSDILCALFKHKKKIIAGTAAGLIAAAAVYFLMPPVYESQAKLLVRYMVERSAVDAVDNPRNTGGYAPTTDTVIGAETEILDSWDLAVQVAEVVGPKRVLPQSRGTPTKEAAAAAITSGLEITTHKGSNIIFVSFKHQNPEVATLVLSELVNRYFTKHLEVHRSAGAFDFVTQQTDQVRARLNQTEDALRDIKEKAGIVSLTESSTALSNEAAKTEEQLHIAEADLAEQQARVQQLRGPVARGSVTIIPGSSEAGATPTPNNATAEHKGKPEGSNAEKPTSESPPNQELPAEIVQQYQVLVSRLPRLRQATLDLLAKYTPKNQMVKENQAEINDVENQRRNLEKRYPDLPTKVAPIGSSKNQQLDPASEAAHLAGLQAKKDSLASRLLDVNKRIQQVSQLAPQIADLERQKELEETNYKYFQGTLEKARVDEALDPSKMPNISAVQRPSPPTVVTQMRNKIVLGLAGGGLGLAVAFALLTELVLDRTVRRPVELEKLIGVNPLVSIPYSAAGYKASPSKRNGKVSALVVPEPGTANNLAPWDTNHFIRSYCEAIRDRIGLYFEVNHLTHKPKLVGVTGFSEGAGASTLAAGLAAALSETGDGKVLLVDVNLGPENVHPFFRGRPAYSLKTALQPAGAIDPAAENLYLARVGAPNSGPAQLGLKKFFDLMPNLKASDFDYIIFDMPPLAQTSPTLGMAGFMDKLLLVVEADKSNRDTVRRGYSALLAARDNVSVVLNKSRADAPKWVDGEL